jgi:large subunit ribosomal protein L14e
MFEIGRVCVKVAGRDAGETAIVIKIIDENYVLIDGNVRRKKCNILHLEPLKDVIKIKKDASTVEVHKAMHVAKVKVKEDNRVKKTKKKDKNVK